MEPAIKVSQVSKCYRLSERRGYVNLKEVLTQKIHGLVGYSPATQKRDDLWALKDINFEIQKGELVGLIGYNGSGKSTLLRLLAQVTKPTTGKITIRGRIGSLLQIGTGFHPELTGEENIYLSGSILGMSWKEVARKYDEIVAFSEVEKFLRVPVKHYSSGMYLRLAFSVAAHLDTDILLVDEALAVGDIGFRIKCLNKMRNTVRNGTTVLFVSHSMGMINELCSRCLLLQQGRLLDDDLPAKITTKYAQSMSMLSHLIFKRDALSEASPLSLTELRINEGRPITSQQAFRLEMQVEAHRSLGELVLSFGFCTMEGTRLLTVETSWREKVVKIDSTGRKRFLLFLPQLDLTPGFYLLDVLAKNQQGEILDARLSCTQIEVIFPVTQPERTHDNQNSVLLRCEWEKLE